MTGEESGTTERTADGAPRRWRVHSLVIEDFRRWVSKRKRRKFWKALFYLLLVPAWGGVMVAPAILAIPALQVYELPAPHDVTYYVCFGVSLLLLLTYLCIVVVATFNWLSAKAVLVEAILAVPVPALVTWVLLAFLLGSREL